MYGQTSEGVTDSSGLLGRKTDGHLVRCAAYIRSMQN